MHPELGRMVGVERGTGGRVVQFRAVPFASVPARFRQSVLVHSFADSDGDFTRYGAICPQVYNSNFQDGKAYGNVPLPPARHIYDDLKCVNMTLTIPKIALELDGAAKIPIMVWLHGGGLKVGGGANTGLEDCTRLVDTSIEMGRPIMTCAVQYRLGAFGFLSSRELFAEAAALKEPASNFGVWDSINGFEWIQQHGAGFGGDVDNVTAFGESAGAILLSYMIVCDITPSPRPWFRRAILQSGDASTISCTTVSEEQGAFDTLYRRTVSAWPFVTMGQNRVDALREVKADAIANASGISPMLLHPVVDGYLFKTAYSLEDVCRRTHECAWLESFMTGDCEFEGTVFLNLYDSVLEKVTNPNYVFASQISKMFGAAQAARLPEFLRAYELDVYATLAVSKAATYLSALVLAARKLVVTVLPASAEHRLRVAHFLGALFFHSHTYLLARWGEQHAPDFSADDDTGKHATPAYYYHFDKRNPFGDEMYHGYSHHFVDVLYLFGNVDERIATLPGVDVQFEAATSRSMARKWIEYGYGEEPWPSALVGVLGHEGVGGEREGSWVVMSEDEDARVHSRRLAAWRAILFGADGVDGTV
ncbi:Alpha/Beta hydrolase protein [Limtongia smithiae]|uniref:Alpha/Beta hydrolase protein n=1 Tax=Limtongia smithiae TaxID=1125753 RepID=UPI0034D0199A